MENIAIDHLRHGQRTAERFDTSAREGEPPSPLSPDVADTHSYRQALAGVEGALAQLPARCRDIFLADRIEGASHAELAERHGVSVKTVEREVMRAMDSVEASLHRWRGDTAAPAPRTGRRRALSTLLGMAGLGVGSPAIWLAWRQWMPQYQVRLATATGRLLNQPLPDGSTLTLDAASRAEVDFYATRRQVRLLAGSAFFAVARDTERPFVVQAADVQVTVLGTRFEVALEDDAVLVAVDTGRVQVRDGSGARHALGAGQMLRLAPGQTAAVQTVAAVAAWREGWLDFQNTPLAEVARRLERYSLQPLRVEPDAAALPVLGRVRIAAAQGWLRMLPRTLPVSVQEEVQEKEQGPGTGRTLVIRRRS
ncbi:MULTISPECIES: FecR domain-containing protein [unclassified Delftia]|uniref:FecR domain-containing protein n=1 Tax=unclassified Delftia TaxID=2613839 RepID=UPI000ACD729E|nr:MULTISPECIES: FecR domain-containing protein [unclassified Delftia]MDC2857968.1 FecR domain-containing protein [Delftia sp. DT-2]